MGRERREDRSCEDIERGKENGRKREVGRGRSKGKESSLTSLN